jgi:hypothetical protein
VPASEKNTKAGVHAQVKQGVKALHNLGQALLDPILAQYNTS